MYLLFALAQYIWISDDECSDSLHIETLFLNENSFECLDSALILLLMSPNQNEFGIVSHNEVYFFFKEPELINQNLLCGHYVTLDIQFEESLGHSLQFESGESLSQFETLLGFREVLSCEMDIRGDCLLGS